MAQQQFVTFWIDHYLFGVNILNVREINAHTDATPVPLAQESIRGLINLRGQIFTLLDLRFLLGLGHLRLTPDTHNIMLKTNTDTTGSGDNASDRVGFMVDKIGDIITVDEQELEAPPANTGDIDGYYFSQVLKLPNGIVASLINIDHVLTMKEDPLLITA
jgi:purine-binding chemotaxis protein CheW